MGNIGLKVPVSCSICCCQLIHLFNEYSFLIYLTKCTQIVILTIFALDKQIYTSYCLAKKFSWYMLILFMTLHSIYTFSPDKFDIKFIIRLFTNLDVCLGFAFYKKKHCCLCFFSSYGFSCTEQF